LLLLTPEAGNIYHLALACALATAIKCLHSLQPSESNSIRVLLDPFIMEFWKGNNVQVPRYLVETSTLLDQTQTTDAISRARASRALAIQD
jgi:hypothetical protein